MTNKSAVERFSLSRISAHSRPVSPFPDGYFCLAVCRVMLPVPMGLWIKQLDCRHISSPASTPYNPSTFKPRAVRCFAGQELTLREFITSVTAARCRLTTQQSRRHCRPSSGSNSLRLSPRSDESTLDLLRVATQQSGPQWLMCFCKYPHALWPLITTCSYPHPTHAATRCSL